MRTTIALALCFAPLASDSASAQRIQSVLGSRLDLRFRSGEEVSGELFAAGPDSIWLLPRSGSLRSVPFSDIAEARVPRRGLSGSDVMVWALIGGLTSGLALTAACGSVQDAECGAVLPGMMVSWGLVGGITARISGSGSRTVRADPPTLAPYARFPQGLPDRFKTQLLPQSGVSGWQPDTAAGGSPSPSDRRPDSPTHR